MRTLRSTRTSGLKPGGVVFALKCGRSGANGRFSGGIFHVAGGGGSGRGRGGGQLEVKEDRAEGHWEEGGVV